LDWDDVELDNGIISVRPKVAKTRRTRRVDMSDTLLQWINKYHDAIPETVAPSSYTTLRRWRKKVMEECSLSAWPPDIMRHCFATYYLQKHDIDSTIKQLGHTSANMLYDNYRGTPRKQRQHPIKIP
jgi:integrase